MVQDRVMAGVGFFTYGRVAGGLQSANEQKEEGGADRCVWEAGQGMARAQSDGR